MKVLILVTLCVAVVIAASNQSFEEQQNAEQSALLAADANPQTDAGEGRSKRFIKTLILKKLLAAKALAAGAAGIAAVGFLAPKITVR